jgi:hypothetical protein
LGLKVNWLYDQQLFGAKKLELTTLPGVVVVSPSGNIEYARNTNDPEWGREFVAAVVRTQRGDSVATEMTADYQEYLDRYQKKLQLVSAARWVRTEGMPTLGEGIGQNDVKTVVGQRIWENQELTQPGNIYRSSNKQGDLILLAFDGWRTLCELDAQGKLLNRRSLDLPAGAAASSLRETRGTGKEKCFALFSILNRTVYLFDEDWKLRGQAESPRRDPILECEFATRNGREVLVAAFQNEGILTFDIDGQRQEKLLETPADSLAVHGDQLLVIRRGGAVAFDLKAPSLGEEGRALESSLQLTRFVRCGTMPGGCLAIGVDADSNWQVVDLTSQTSSWKPQLVGSQMFESLIEPGMGWTQNGKQNVVAADTFGQVHVLLDNGTKRGTLACDQGLGGIEVVQMGQELTIITSGTRGIMAWRVQ